MTISEIKSIAKETFGGRKQSLIECEEYKISIVGGPGLYGDFEKTFEIAVMTKDGSFITKNFVDGLADDVIGYYSIEETENFVNRLIFSN
jgi:hypothetical protein